MHAPPLSHHNSLFMSKHLRENMIIIFHTKLKKFITLTSPMVTGVMIPAEPPSTRRFLWILKHTSSSSHSLCIARSRRIQEELNNRNGWSSKKEGRPRHKIKKASNDQEQNKCQSSTSIQKIRAVHFLPFRGWRGRVHPLNTPQDTEHRIFRAVFCRPQAIRFSLCSSIEEGI